MRLKNERVFKNNSIRAGVWLVYDLNGYVADAEGAVEGRRLLEERL